MGFRSIYIFPVSLVDDNILDFTSNHKAKNKKKRLKISWIKQLKSKWIMDFRKINKDFSISPRSGQIVKSNICTFKNV